MVRTGRALQDAMLYGTWFVLWHVYGTEYARNTRNTQHELPLSGLRVVRASACFGVCVSLDKRSSFRALYLNGRWKPACSRCTSRARLSSPLNAAAIQHACDNGMGHWLFATYFLDSSWWPCRRRNCTPASERYVIVRVVYLPHSALLTELYPILVTG